MVVEFLPLSFTRVKPRRLFFQGQFLKKKGPLFLRPGPFEGGNENDVVQKSLFGFSGRRRQDMPGDGGRNQKKRNSHPPPVDYKYGGEHGGTPHYAQRQEFGTHRYSFVPHKVADIKSEIAVTHRPNIQPPGTPEVKPTCKQPEWSSGKQRHKNANGS